MVLFEPYGPFDVPLDKHPSGRLISEDLSPFWKRHQEVASEVGCYIFSIKTGRAVVPYYVGMTTESFENECFTDHKLKHYHQAIAAYARGKPVMSYIVHPRRKGKTNIKAIEELENFLIQAGMAVNPALRNVRGRTEPRWGIKGVIRSGPGKASIPASQFAQMMNIKK